MSPVTVVFQALQLVKHGAVPATGAKHGRAGNCREIGILHRRLLQTKRDAHNRLIEFACDGECLFPFHHNTEPLAIHLDDRIELFNHINFFYTLCQFQRQRIGKRIDHADLQETRVLGIPRGHIDTRRNAK